MTVEVIGWNKGLLVISAIRFFMESGKLGLADSKRKVEEILDGESVQFSLTGCQKEEAEEELRRLGLIFEWVDED